MTFGEMIVEAREKKNWSKAELLRVLHANGYKMCSNTLNGHEDFGILPRNRERTCEMYSKVLSIPYDELYALSEQPNIVQPNIVYEKNAGLKKKNYAKPRITHKITKCAGCIYYCSADTTCCYMIDTGKKRGIPQQDCYMHENTPYTPGVRPRKDLLKVGPKWYSVDSNWRKDRYSEAYQEQCENGGDVR